MQSPWHRICMTYQIGCLAKNGVALVADSNEPGDLAFRKRHDLAVTDPLTPIWNSYLSML